MSGHDPMFCRYPEWERDPDREAMLPPICDCDFIDRIRADERRHAEMARVIDIAVACDKVLTDLRAEVEESFGADPHWNKSEDWGNGYAQRQREIIDLIDEI